MTVVEIEPQEKPVMNLKTVQNCLKCRTKISIHYSKIS